jgi:hypothetical protein
MNWLKTFLFFFFVFFITTASSQVMGDYRAVTSGNWTTDNIWEYFNGTIWVDASITPGNHPGEFGTTANDVTIANGIIVTLNSAIPGSINSVTIGDKVGTAVVETLSITGTSSLNTLEFNIAYDGLLKWDSNSTFSLPNNASFFIESPNPDGLVLGTGHGVYINPTGCNVNKKLVIGATIYTNCNGGGPNPKPITFNDANNNGGNLGVAPSSNSPVCSGLTVNLFANASGTDAPGASYNWTVTSSPVAYSFTDTNENPTDSPTVIGTYVYEVTATNGSVSNTNSVSVEITSCNKTIITNRRITFRVKK